VRADYFGSADGNLVFATIPYLAWLAAAPGYGDDGLHRWRGMGLYTGILKARLKVNEILSTIMMNFIALQLMNCCCAAP